MKKTFLNALARVVCVCLVVGVIVSAQPRPAKADVAWTFFPVVGAVVLGSVAVNEGIMLACQRRPLQLRELAPSMLPVWSQIQALKGCAPAVRKK